MVQEGQSTSDNNLEKCHRGPRFELGLKAGRRSSGGEQEKGILVSVRAESLRGAMLSPFHCIAEMLLADDLFLSLCTLSSFGVPQLYIRVCLVWVSPSVYRMNGFQSEDSCCICFRVTAAFLLKIL